MESWKEDSKIIRIRHVFLLPMQLLHMFFLLTPALGASGRLCGADAGA